MKDEEYLRLPHGMFDREEEWIKRERKILEFHSQCGEKIGCKLKKYSPLSYSSTFIRGANTAKDKVYTLNSKSGKSLILSCDSTPSVFRNYITNSNVHYELSLKAQGKTIVHLHNDALEDLEILVPPISEQQRLSSFFTSLDNLINDEVNYIDQLTRVKSTLLQKMFV